MITWRDVMLSMYRSSHGRLDDPAHVIIDGELVEIDLVEMEVDEIGDDRLVAIPTQELEEKNDEEYKIPRS